jgi:hypothetical protein
VRFTDVKPAGHFFAILLDTLAALSDCAIVHNFAMFPSTSSVENPWPTGLSRASGRAFAVMTRQCGARIQPMFGAIIAPG